MKISILTLFPEMFEALNHSIMKRAKEGGRLKLELINIRDYTTNKHKKVDDTPYGGGSGMVIMPEPLFLCIEDVQKTNKGPVIFLTPQGETFKQEVAEELSQESELILLCGHYEGIDQRVRDHLVDREISIGNYVLTGGELPAMILTDAIMRLVPGVLGSDESFMEESFSENLDRMKEYPHYTKPAEFRGMKVPDVLLSGHHAEIEKWKKANRKP